MRVSSRWARKQIACSLAMLLVVSFADAAPAPLQEPVSSQEMQSAPANQGEAHKTDDQAKTPDSNITQPEKAPADIPKPDRPQAGDQNGQPGTPQSASDQEQSGAPKPVGTAAAPYAKTTGVAASRPAGAVIAPAKQRRARTILIRVSLAVGAVAAVGTVVALSHGSPSRP